MVHGLVAFKSAIMLNSDWSFFIYIMNDNFIFFLFNLIYKLQLPCTYYLLFLSLLYHCHL